MRRPLEDDDYVLSPRASSFWVTVGNISVHIIRHEEGVACDMYPLGHEMDDPLASAYADFNEAEEEINAIRDQ